MHAISAHAAVPRQRICEKQQLQVKLFCFLNATVQEYPAHHMQFILCESLPLPPELTCSV